MPTPASTRARKHAEAEAGEPGTLADGLGHGGKPLDAFIRTSPVVSL